MSKNLIEITDLNRKVDQTLLILDKISGESLIPIQQGPAVEELKKFNAFLMNICQEVFVKEATEQTKEEYIEDVNIRFGQLLEDINEDIQTLGELKIEEEIQ